MMRRTLTVSAAAAIAVALAASAASAKEKVKPAPHALPGVDAGYSIVKPMPEPDEPADVANGDRYFKFGNTEVHIGGYVRVDIGVGSLQPRSKH
jgi:hypothetical protein